MGPDLTVRGNAGGPPDPHGQTFEAAGLSKAFGGTPALVDVSLRIAPGTVEALIGENGAGKSTLIKILAGVHRADAGRLAWSRQPFTVSAPDDARRAGIAVLHQDTRWVDGLGVLDNLFMGRPDYGSGRGWVSPRRLERLAHRVFDRYGYSVSLRGLGRDMSPSARTLTALTRCLLDTPRLLVLDEPTASLGSAEVETLLGVVARLCERGSAVLFVSHRLDEVLAVAGHITVLRNGRVVDRVASDRQSRRSLVALMSGSERAAPDDGAGPAAAAPVRRELLRVDGLSTSDGRVEGVALSVGSGEILGLYGLAGAGRTELLESLYGTRTRSAGKVSMGGRESRGTVRDALKSGLRLVPEDRRRQSLVFGTSVGANLHLGQLHRFARRGVISAARETDHAARSIAASGIRTTGPAQPVAELSGGNQQKVVFARIVRSVDDASSAVLLCDEPTQAVDVGTRRAVHVLIRDHVARGGGAIVATSDIEELLALCDRVVVLCEGRVAGRFDTRPFRREDILQRCFPARPGARPSP